jgi:uncharacterized protein YdhG (YjbR/CyaY superfamily)
MGLRTHEVDAYLDALPAERREALSALRSLIEELVPEAQETMDYRMPTIRYRGHVLAAYASPKHYMSFYSDIKVVQAHRHELPGLSVGKSCVRFRRLEQWPLDVVRQIVLESKAQIDKVEGEPLGEGAVQGKASTGSGAQ